MNASLRPSRAQSATHRGVNIAILVSTSAECTAGNFYSIPFELVVLYKKITAKECYKYIDDGCWGTLCVINISNQKNWYNEKQ